MNWNWKKILSVILIAYGATSLIVTVIVMLGTNVNAALLAFLNPLQALIARYIQAQTGYSLVSVGYVGWGFAWIFGGWAMKIWAKRSK